MSHLTNPPFPAHLTRDGRPIHFGPGFYLLCRLADPTEEVHVVDWEPKGSSLIDGEPLIRYIVQNKRGDRFLIEPWQLSRIPADELYKQLKAQRTFKPASRARLRVPVMDVRLAS